MTTEWYDEIAKRNGGYKSNAIYTIEGISAEEIFEEELVKLLKHSQKTLDAGCGHGEFTLKMAQHAKKIVGFDNSRELLKLAKENLKQSGIRNVEFVYGSTHETLPLQEETFDLIYDRRGPTSIINHPYVLKKGGVIFGIHTGALDTVKQRLAKNPFTDIEIKEYKDAKMIFPDEEELTKYLSSIPGNPNYFLPQYQDELKEIIKEHREDGKYVYKQYRYIWKAIKF